MKICHFGKTDLVSRLQSKNQCKIEDFCLVGYNACNPVKINRRFKTKDRFLIQGGGVSQAGSQHEASSKKCSAIILTAVSRITLFQSRVYAKLLHIFPSPQIPEFFAAR
jgi:hypothetical protein